MISKSLEKSLVYLVKTGGRLKQGAQLPGIGSCARELGVAYLTMLKAAHILVDQGILAGGHGKRFSVSKPGQIMRDEALKTLSTSSPVPSASST
ncbi:MAG: hypothetical protein GF398_16395, partial [Chitinivibrionales bacterium]|nr:hypothetical protein [Chitinivibrionales bacterium]